MVRCFSLKNFLCFTAMAACLNVVMFIADQVWLNEEANLEDCSGRNIKVRSLDTVLRRAIFEELSTHGLNCSNPNTKRVPNKNASLGESGKLLGRTTTATKTTSRNIAPKIAYSCGKLEGRTSVYGQLNLHTWYGWCGHAVDDLRRNPLFPLKPTRNTLLKTFLINQTNGYFSGRRIFGYIHPPVTGNYIIAVSSAEGSELWLSTDDNPKNSKKIAYIGEPENQYAAASRFLDFTRFKSQMSQAISLVKGRVYYIEALQKHKHSQDHIEIAWQKPGDEKLEVIDSRYISQYIDYSADKEEIRARTICVCNEHPSLKFTYNKYMTREKYDMRDDLPFRVETLPFSEVSDVLPSCPYHPSYVVSRKLAENEAFVQGFILPTLVYPDDRTDTNMSHDPNNHISWGNKKLPEKEALQIVSEYMAALKNAKGVRFSLKHIVNIEMKEDPANEKGKRYFLELELEDKVRGRCVRFSEYVYKAKGSANSSLCYPEGHQWRRNVTITMVVTVKNYGAWIKYLIDQLAKIYLLGQERNFNLVIVDFNSSDVDLFKMKDRSAIKDRIVILEQGSEFYKTKALNKGVSYVKDPHSIIFTADLHIKFPANIFDIIRKHTIEGRSFYSPAVLKIKCGYSITHLQGYWEMMGYGLFGGYKADWDSFGGMDAEKFTTRWGGEDWDLMDRAIGAGLEIERVRLPKFYHYHHDRKSDWYEHARM